MTTDFIRAPLIPGQADAVAWEGYEEDGKSVILKDGVLQRVTDLLPVLRAHPPAASARIAELEAALRSVMALKPARDAFHYLDRGIGTKTQEGIAWLAARAALAGGRA